MKLGFRATGVDIDRNMLAHVDGDVRTIACDIIHCDLGERFDVVVLASFLINSSVEDEPRLFLQACRRHVADDGCVLIQTTSLAWAQQLASGQEWSTNGYRTIVLSAALLGKRLSAKFRYEKQGSVWTHSWNGILWEAPDLCELAASVGLYAPSPEGLSEDWCCLLPTVDGSR